MDRFSKDPCKRHHLGDCLDDGRSSRRRCSVKKGVLKNCAGKHLCWSLFLIKLQAFRPATLLKRDSNTSGFLYEIDEILQNTYFEEHLRMAVFVLTVLTMRDVFRRIQPCQTSKI